MCKQSFTGDPDFSRPEEPKMSLTLVEIAEAVPGASGQAGDVPLLHARHIHTASLACGATAPAALFQLHIHLHLWLCPRPVQQKCQPPICKLRCRLAPNRKHLSLLTCKPWALEALKSVAWVSILWTSTFKPICFLLSIPSFSCRLRPPRHPHIST